MYFSLQKFSALINNASKFINFTFLKMMKSDPKENSTLKTVNSEENWRIPFFVDPHMSVFIVSVESPNTPCYSHCKYSITLLISCFYANFYTPSD